MKTDYTHGIAVNGRVRFAPFRGAAGYFPIEDVMPQYPDGKIAVADHWENKDGKCICIYAILDAPKAVRRFSKLKIYGAIAKIGAWDAIHGWLEGKTIDGINGWMAFQLAQEISDDHPLFAPLAAEAKTMLGLTDEQFEELLESCLLED